METTEKTILNLLWYCLYLQFNHLLNFSQLLFFLSCVIGQTDSSKCACVTTIIGHTCMNFVQSCKTGNNGGGLSSE